MFLVVFRNRKRAGLDQAAYGADAARMEELARAQPGFLSFKSYVAEDGEVMRDILAGDPADLLMIDIQLPGEDGLKLTRELRARSEVGIILVTGRSDAVDRIVGLEIGAGTPEEIAMSIMAEIVAARNNAVSSQKAEPQLVRTARL